ncbi:DUF4158 domain-containing protein [Klebsiella quasipneumoniae]|uniref:DUF4158 domain-containing protein n=1 Tax=Klebsiella quasipneumoniae TaxID=1463165 RepID=UPI00388F7470
MPRRSILSAAERDSLLALPDTQDELIRLYTFSEPDLSLIRQRRGDANRLGVAVQLCLLRFPGQGLLPDAAVPMPLLQWIGRQLRIDPSCWPQYAEREETRREHLLELRAYLGMEPFGLAHYRQAVHAATELALQTDKGIMLANSVLDDLRHRHVILPTLDVVERVCAEAITRANRQIYETLSEPLSDAHRRRLDDLLKRDNGRTTWLAWLRQSPVKPNSPHMLEHIERLKAWQAAHDLPSGIERLVHQNRLLQKIIRGRPDDARRRRVRGSTAALLPRPEVALAIEACSPPSPTKHRLHDHIGQEAVQCRQSESISSSSGIHRQSDQCQGAAVRASARALIEGQKYLSGPRSVPRHHRAIMSWGCFSPSGHRSAEARAARGLRFPAPHRRELRHVTPVQRRNFSTCSSCGPRPPPGRRRHRGAAARTATTPARCHRRRPVHQSRAGGSW